MGFERFEGKTKIVTPHNGQTALACLTQKDTISKGDGAVIEEILGKGALSNQITCNVFELFKRKGLPVAYHSKLDETSFLAFFCAMIPLEVVVRGFASGSYLKRHPETEPDHQFQPPVLEFYYKTSGRRFPLVFKHQRDRPPLGVQLACDDPLLRFVENQNTLRLYHPRSGALMLTLGSDQRVAHLRAQCAEIDPIAQCAFKILQKSWKLEHGKLIDVKFEFGVGPDGRILLADVVDADSWRVTSHYNGQQLSKQAYRDGASLKTMLKIYKEVVRLTDHFKKH